MPLYEYECKQCQRRTEKIQKFSDPEITECPHCGGPLERVLSAPAISFKGGGWYADGYGNAKPAASKSEGKEGKSDSGSSSGSASETSAAPAKDSSSAPAAGASTSTPAPASTPSSSSSGSDKK